MASLSVQSIVLSSSAVDLTWNSCGASGDTFSNNGRTIVLAKNTGASAATVTLAATQTVTDASLSVPDLAVTVSTSETRVIGPLPKATFNNSSSKVSMTYASSSSMTIGLLKW